MEESTPQTLSPRRGFTVTSTSRHSATVSPLVLRETDFVRLVFKPVMVDNINLPEASVDGVFCYQRKRRADYWEDVEAISLSALRAGEGVRVDLRSSEILKLYRGLQTLYDTVSRDGVPRGVHTYIQADRGTVLADVASLLTEGGTAELLQTFVKWARGNSVSISDQMRSVDNETLINFDAAIGVARLSRFIEEASANLENDDESYWQTLLGQQSWAISQLYASPMIIVREQAYVGGKSISNRGGSIVDYMFKNSLTENALIVELKTPAVELMKPNVYRNGAHSPSRELAGATQQLLNARQQLQDSYLSLANGSDRPGFSIFGTKALLVIGKISTDKSEIRSFEIYRNAQRGIEIVTFDELLAKGQLLLGALSA
jgi:hypothetical protein